MNPMEDRKEKKKQNKEKTEWDGRNKSKYISSHIKYN